MKKYLSLVLAVVMILCLIPATTVFAAKEEVINQVELTVVAPVEGEKPAYDKIDGRGYYSDNGAWGTSTRIYKNGIAWYKSSSSYFSPGTTETFNANTSYTVKINLLPKGNFEFSKNVTAKINGKTATVEVFDDGSILAQTTLSSTSSNKTVIKKVDLNVVKPVVGKTPTFAKVDTTQYFSEKYGTVSNCSNGVTWTNQSSGINLTVSNPFKEGVKYRVTYYLTAKDGYKFNTATACTINGSVASISITDATHAKVSLGDLVPGDGKKEVSSVSIYVTAPKDGEKPNYTKIDGTQYYSDNGINGISTKIYKNGIAWYKSASSYISPGTTETFKGGSEYTVKIALTAKDGYKFAKNVSAKLNGKTATVETFDDGSINVSVKLTALSKEHKHTNSSWKTDKDNHWKVCTDTACGMLTVAKEAHKDVNKDNKCDVCSYAIPKSTDTTSTPDSTPADKPTEPSDSEEPITSEPSDSESKEAVDNTDEDKDSKDKEDGKSSALIWIILGGVVLLAAGGAVTFIVIKKKKTK